MAKDKIYQKNPDVVFRKIADEYILVPIRRNIADLESIYTLNKVAARIWELIDKKNKASEIKKIITEEFRVGPEDAEKDLGRFLKELELTGCIEESNNEMS